MSSGAWISTYMIFAFLFVVFFVVSFTIWEFVQLARRRAGNRSARTATQWVEHMADRHPFWKRFAIYFPYALGAVSLFLLLVSIWLAAGHWSV